MSVADGSACILVNGHVVAQGSQFSMKDVEVVMACVNLDNVSVWFSTVLFLSTTFFYILLGLEFLRG